MKACNTAAQGPYATNVTSYLICQGLFVILINPLWLLLIFWHCYEVQKCSLHNFRGLAYFCIFFYFIQFSYRPSNIAWAKWPYAAGRRVKAAYSHMDRARYSRKLHSEHFCT